MPFLSWGICDVLFLHPAGPALDRPALDRRLVDLADDVRAFVFLLLDSEPDWTGDDAGAVAAACERAFLECLQ